LDCAATLSGSHIFRARGPKRRGGIRTCLCGLAEPRIERHIMSPSEVHVEMGCPCAGDLELCERIYLAADRASVSRRLANNESTHRLLRAEMAKLQEQIGRSALRILELRQQHADLTESLREADDRTA
jgi:hypothetical protein